MTLDLLIRNGRVVDGSGDTSISADIGIKDGRIVEIGQVEDAARRTIDADGLAVAPGFIDHHTHMDAQLLWDPYGTSEPQHGITTVIIGNCGLSLAPVGPDGVDALVQSFSRVEAMPRETLESGIAWDWRTFREYLDALGRRLGINVGGTVGHVAVRHHVMGEDAVERDATEAEIERMRELVRDAMYAGALGFSTNRNSRHMREDGKPIASRFANDAEVFALCDVLTELDAGLIQVILGLHKAQYLDWYDGVVRRTGRPLTWQSVMHRWDQPNLWREQLDGIARTFEDGYRAYGLAQTVPLIRRFSLKSAQVFDEFPTWKTVLFLPETVRKQAFADPDTRAKLKADMAGDQPCIFHRRWDLVDVETVARPENASLVGISIAELAARRGQHPIDALVDLSIEEDLATGYRTVQTGGDPEAMGEILRSPYVLAGTSDAGAHVQFGANFGYATTLLSYWVRERPVMTLEQAVYKLTHQVASAYDLADRGLLREGYAADVVIFDPETVAALEPEWVNDYPGGTRRLAQRSEGVCYTIVNGRVILEDGQLTGDLPGQVLRGGAYRPAAAAVG